MNGVTARKETAVIIFGEKLPSTWTYVDSQVSIVLAPRKLKNKIEAAGFIWHPLEELVSQGSVYEAGALLEEVSLLRCVDGSRITESFRYLGYELWWLHYDSLFYYFCAPYTQFRNLLEYLKSFQDVYLYNVPYKALFSAYFEAHGIRAVFSKEDGVKSPSFLPLGVLLQIAFTFVSLLVLVVRRSSMMIYTGDKCEKGKDYDPRMRFIYEELRQGGHSFVEFVRSLESWKTVIRNAFIRHRPVIYAEAITFIGRFCGIISGGRRRARREANMRCSFTENNPDVRFKYLIAMQFLPAVYDDIWAIRIARWILRIIGIKAAFIPAASERNLHTVLGCKANKIPVVGIMHGVATRYGTPYDFLPGFDNGQKLSVDRYGVWSEWWKDYYVTNSDAYAPEQLHVSGPMRPVALPEQREPSGLGDESTHVLFISEQLAEPREILPYLRKLLGQQDLTITIKFRPYRDGFEEWLKEHEPELLKSLAAVRGSMEEAVASVDVVVGSYSTAALEAFMQLKAPIFMHTSKWGDYYEMNTSPETDRFFAHDPQELVKRIGEAREAPRELLAKMRERYFGDPKKNGSAWVVNTLVAWAQK